MTPERWRQITAIFHEAIRVAEPARANLLSETCRDDPTLRQEVEALIRAHTSAGGFGDTPLLPTAPNRPRFPAGTRLGAFRIDALIGTGGMGEVYRAFDTRLGRSVALKVLPDSVARDPDRVARLQREARVLAALNDPHIAAIYGVEDVDGILALVLELVEGPTLAEMLVKPDGSRQPLPIDTTVDIGRQIASALDAAHERGVVHRDLKPANIKVTADGVVKILDFGIAKAVEQTSFDVDTTDAVTATQTEHSLIVGTAAYMSPEQARGQVLDKRSDIWSFGCVLYEMLTGRTAFSGDTVSDTIARVLTGTPDWTALPGDTPAGLHRLLSRCLERSLKRRLRDFGDIELASEIEPTVSSGTTVGTRTKTIAVLSACAGAILAATLIVWARRDPGLPPATQASFQVPLGVRPTISGAFALSPDGRHLAFAGVGADAILRLWVRSLDTLVTRPVTGTEAQIGENSSLFWSADSQFIAFYADGSIKKVDRLGGAPQAICRVPGVAVGGSWSDDGTIAVGSTTGGLHVCPAVGGEARELTRVDESSRGTIHVFPSFLPDKRHVLYLRVSRDDPSKTGVYVADTTLPPNDQSDDRLLETGFSAKYVPGTGRPGRVLFVRDKSLWATRMDTTRIALVGEPQQLASNIGSFRDAAFFDASPDVLVYRTGNPQFQLVWRDRRGELLGEVGAPDFYTGITMSPDATRAVVVRGNPLARADQDLWVVDLKSQTRVRFSADGFLESPPTWSADGRQLIFALGNDGADLWSRPLGGAPGRRILSQEDHRDFRINPVQSTFSTTADGRFVVFSAEDRGSTQSDLWLLPLQTQGKPTPLLQQEFDQRDGAISPDGRWLAYVSNETGANEVFVRSFAIASGAAPTVGLAAPVSHGGGVAPRWRSDSKELFYQSTRGAAMAVSVKPDGVGEPSRLFEAPGMLSQWGVSPDGGRFLIAVPVGQGEPAPFTVTLAWQQ